jgi:hypothetical protein
MTPEQTKEWDSTAKSIMLNLMYDSYVQNPKAAEKLLATGNATITHTQDDTRWKKDFPEVTMTVRDMLREELPQPQATINTQVLDFKTMPEFTIDRKREILSNFALKHGVTQQEAYDYINQALNNKTKNPTDILNKLKECY